MFERPKSAGGCWDREVHFAPFKICIRQIGSEPIATIVDNPYAVTGNIFTIIHDDLNKLKYILAIFNSKFIKYFWKINFHDFKTSFPQVTINSLNSIPIKFGNHDFQVSIVEKVNMILDAKNLLSCDTAELENQIDQLVYQLYELTEEEIRIVEGNG